MNRILFLWLFVLAFSATNASHLVGGDFTYTCLGNNQYRIKLTMFRDCANSQVLFDNTIPVAIYEGSTLSFTIPVDITNLIPNIPLQTDSCSPPPPSNVCVEYAEYIDTIFLPPSPQGYTIVHQRCCRNNVIFNIVNPGSTGNSFFTGVPPNDTACNNSVQFLELPKLLMCFGQSNIIEIPTTDPDGDSLVFSLCDPYLGGGQMPNNGPNGVVPNPPTGPPYSTVTHSPGFSGANPIHGTPGLTINPQTGTLTVVPDPIIGFFTVAVCVDEYRNGQLINTTQREMQYVIADCILSTSAGIQSQADLGADATCRGRTIEFRHFSSGMLEAFWIFNDSANAPNDTSTAFNPTYTFSDTGFFEVMLIINQGIPGCNDTAVEIFEIRDSVDNWFTWGESPCLDKGLDFKLEGTNLSPNASIEWNFGVNATPQTWSGPDPPPVVFTNDGNLYEVNLTTEDYGCESFYYEQLTLHERISLDITGHEVEVCAPHTAVLNSQATARGPIRILWDMGDGTTYNNNGSIEHTYTTPGVYYPRVAFRTTSFCIDTISVDLDPIYVLPSPDAQLSASSTRLLMYDPTLTFISQFSDDVVYSELHTGDGHVFVPAPPSVEYTYDADSAYFVAFTVGENLDGCIDTSFIDIYVVPETNIYIPNAFTPDGDGINDWFNVQVTNVGKFEFRIHNRWGQEVFVSQNPSNHWDGNVNGEPAPMGVYVYTLKLQDQQGEWHYRTGSLTLIR